MQIKFKKVREVETPIYATEGAAAMDLFAATNPEYNVEKNYYEIKTGIAIQVPEGYGAFILPRSSISNKGIVLANSLGLGDPDFRGELCVRFKPIDPNYTIYEKGERIAQLVIIQTPKVTLIEVDELDETVRGEGGFGSTNSTESVCIGSTATVISNGDGVSSIQHRMPIGAKVDILEGPDEDGDYEVKCDSIIYSQYVNSQDLKFD